MDRNLLSGETSPYLLQHADNPVHWQPWGDDALAQAKEQNKPILLSIGYAACHWCHVMAHESFENDETADVMNELYINVKVDREERPDLDALYQAALALMGQQGGWPLTIFLTPEGKPFWGGTYFPPQDQYGRPAFKTILRQLNETYRASPEKVSENVKQIDEALQHLSNSAPGGDITPSAINDIAMRLARQVDPFFGGLGDAPKFPTPSAFSLLWRSHLETGSEPFKLLTLTTLDGMCEGGIYDHLRGGFARYSTDEEWLAPHFEKMLYDNAQLIELLTMVWRTTGSTLYAQRIEETIDWLRDEMLVPGGGFSSTLDADSEGEEGKFYVWSEREVDAVLANQPAEKVSAFKRAYDVDHFGNWEGKVILNRRRAKGPYDPEVEASFAEFRKLLLTIRDGRIRPGWDDKVLADWNGMMIAGLADAGSAFNRPDWIDMAETAFAFILKNLAKGKVLLHSWRDGTDGAPGLLEDYAEMARAALALYHVTQKQEYLEHAAAWVDEVQAHFHDSEGGGYFQSPSDRTDLIARMKPTADNATPSGNGTMMEVLSRLYHLTGDERYRARVEALVQAFAGTPISHMSAMGRFLDGVRRDRAGNQVVIVSNDPADAAALRNAVYSSAGFDAVLTCLQSGQDLHDLHPAKGKGLVDGIAAAYVCHGMVCSAPITDPEKLENMLRGNYG